MTGVMERIGEWCGFVLLILLILALADWLKIVDVKWFWEDMKSCSEQIEEVEQRARGHPGVFDWGADDNICQRINMRESMVYNNVVLEHSLMDDYILYILSNCQLDKNNSVAILHLYTNAQAYPDLKFLAAACYLKVGDLFRAKGNRKDAKSLYSRISGDISMPRQYRALAEERLRGLK